MKTVFAAVFLVWVLCFSPAQGAFAQSLSTVHFAASEYVVEDGADVVTLTVERIGPPDGTASIDFQTQDGSALEGTDYIVQGGNLYFGTGTNLNVVIPILANSELGCGRTFSVVLSNPDPFDTELGSPTIATVVIRPCSTYRFATNRVVVNENAGMIAFNVERRGGTNGPGEVSFIAASDFSALPGVDYSETYALLTFAPGETNKTVLVPILDNVWVDGTRRFGAGLFVIVVEEGGEGWKLGVDETEGIIYDDDCGEICLRDRTVEAGIRAALGVPEGVISREQLESITELDFTRWPKVNSLVDLALLPNLSVLRLRGSYPNCGGDWSCGGHPLPDGIDASYFEPLSSLQHLTTLDLSLNRQTHFFLPPDLYRLTNLVLAGNPLMDLSFIRPLTNLMALNLDASLVGRGWGYEWLKNQVEDYSPLADLPHLKSLTIRNTSLTNLDFGGLDNALETLDLSGNQLSNVDFLQRCPELKWLNLSVNPLTESTDFLPMTRLSKLDVLLMNGVQTWEFTLPTELHGLSRLSMNGSGLYFLNLPPEMTNLVTLELGGNHLGQLGELQFLDGLSGLTNLDLSHNLFSTISIPPTCTNLTSLDLSWNQLTNLHLPDGLHRLERLDVSANPLSRLYLPNGLGRLSVVRVYDVPFDTITLAPDINPQARIEWFSPPLKLVIPETHAYASFGWLFLNVYPLGVSLSLGRPEPNVAPTLSLSGPPGTYTVLGSSNLVDWSDWRTATNELGQVVVSGSGDSAARYFFRARRDP